MLELFRSMMVEVEVAAPPGSRRQEEALTVVFEIVEYWRRQDPVRYTGLWHMTCEWARPLAVRQMAWFNHCSERVEAAIRCGDLAYVQQELLRPGTGYCSELRECIADKDNVYADTLLQNIMRTACKREEPDALALLIRAFGRGRCLDHVAFLLQCIVGEHSARSLAVTDMVLNEFMAAIEAGERTAATMCQWLDFAKSRPVFASPEAAAHLDRINACLAKLQPPEQVPAKQAQVTEPSIPDHEPESTGSTATREPAKRVRFYVGAQRPQAAKGPYVPPERPTAELRPSSAGLDDEHRYVQFADTDESNTSSTSTSTSSSWSSDQDEEEMESEDSREAQETLRAMQALRPAGDAAITQFFRDRYRALRHDEMFDTDVPWTLASRLRSRYAMWRQLRPDLDDLTDQARLDEAVRMAFNVAGITTARGAVRYPITAKTP